MTCTPVTLAALLVLSATPRPAAEADGLFQQFLDAIITERHQFVELVQGDQ
jgi:hypothetical protein